MFVLSFVLEDWAIQELVPSPRHRRTAMLLVASSYVTWTYQTHTFSNSIETLAVAWSLVLIQRIVEDKNRSSPFASGILGGLVVFGVFNRITFPAFLFIPGLRLVPHFWRKPISLLMTCLSGLSTLFMAIALDTEFYAHGHVTWFNLLSRPVITPLNNLTYNLSVSNLASHGLHPWYQHILVNLPLLLGPGLLLWPHPSLRLYSALSGIFVLSLFQHQEARFLLPTVPLILSSVQLPRRQKYLRIWVGLWIAFNTCFGILMGVYHQGGVVPMQVFLSQQNDAVQALWWKTYSPPIWLLDGKNEVLQTLDAMGMDRVHMIEEMEGLTSCGGDKERLHGTYLIAPMSAKPLDEFLSGSSSRVLRFEQVWEYRRHLNLDDLDFTEDGIWPTIRRVIGRRGLAAWKITQTCVD
ncbi:MAG: alpha 1,2 mannosyltransferase [Claussenomyces sp. TS43310]|nr:MAG: alpha 1,2 mannosyltransferase [Claussenomyces sp. TS43310]